MPATRLPVKPVKGFAFVAIVSSYLPYLKG